MIYCQCQIPLLIKIFSFHAVFRISQRLYSIDQLLPAQVEYPKVEMTKLNYITKNHEEKLVVPIACYPFRFLGI